LKLEERDKRVLIFGGAAAALILLYALVLYPISSDLSRKRDLIPKKEKDLAEMKVLRTQYVEIRQRLQEAQAIAAQRGPLLTEIENYTKQSNLSSKIVSLKPQAGVQTEGFKESIVEVRLENITLYDIVNYVYLLEKNALRIRKLQFKPRYDNPKLLNATILVSSAG
jgi:type II secretory pathway component PulM